MASGSERMIEASAVAGNAPFQTSNAYRYYVVWMLCGVYTINMLDRQLLSILIEPIRIEFSLNDTHMGFLGGIAFAIFYTTLGLPLARIADRGNRVNMIAICIAVWSLFTALTGVAKSFSHLLLARIGVAVGEAGCNPAAYSVITDYFESKRRATALSIYQLGAYAGGFLGLLLGGAIAQSHGWRMAFFVVGIPGLLIALILKLTVREPPRGFSDPALRAPQTQRSMLQVLKALSAKRSFRNIGIATALHNFAVYGTGNFYSAFLMRSHGMSLAEVGTLLAFVTLIGGVMGAYVGGMLSDKLAVSKQDSRYYLWVPALLLIVGFPISQIIFATQSSTVVMLLLVPAIFCAAAFLAPSLTATYGLVGLRERALASALLLFVLNLIGLGFGPLFTGIVSDALRGWFVERGAEEAQALADGLRWSLRIMTVVSLCAAYYYFRAARTLREESYRDEPGAASN